MDVQKTDNQKKQPQWGVFVGIDFTCLVCEHSDEAGQYCMR
jgi:hypothetical protein